jgi:serine protease Do
MWQPAVGLEWENVMMEWTAAPQPALRRSRRTALFFGGIGIATGAFIASPHFPIGRLITKETTPPVAAGKRAPYAPGRVSSQVASQVTSEVSAQVSAQVSSQALGFAGLARTVRPAVIAIVARATETDAVSRAHGTLDGQRSRLVTSQGSGFFITADGFAVTSNHVIKGSVSIEVRTDSGDMFRARVIGTDAVTDLAVIKVDAPRDFAHVKFADAPPQVGDWVIAVGNPFGLGGTVTAGIVSARGRDVEKESDTYEDLLQIDAPINKGNSGGPTFDLAGNVVGVNTVILSPTGGSIGIAFAIPAEKAKQITGQLKEAGAVARPWLGIQFQSVLPDIADSLELPEPAGILIADVQTAGPAANAGIAAGDVVDSVNGAAIRNAHDFSRAIDDLPPHSIVILGIRKKGRQDWVAVTVGQAPAPPRTEPTVRNDDGNPGANAGGDHPQGQTLGLKLLALGALDGSGSGGQRGVMVVEVEPGGLAAGRGIDPGDLILDVADEAIGAPEDVYRLVDTAKNAGKRSILMRIKSGDTAKFVAVPIG